jgi:hypothetical protein
MDDVERENRELKVVVADLQRSVEELRREIDSGRVDVVVRSFPFQSIALLNGIVFFLIDRFGADPDER